MLETYVRNLFNQHGDTRLVFHNYSFAKSLAEEAQRLMKEGKLNGSQTTEVMNTAAWFYPTGYIFDFKNPSKKSLEQAEKYFEESPSASLIKTDVLNCLKTGWDLKPAETQAEMLFRDAVNATRLGDETKNNSELFRLELELIDQQVFTPTDWINYNLRSLLNIDFKTAAAKTLWEPVLAQRILNQKEKLDKIRRKSPAKRPTKRPAVTNDSRREAERMIATFFRSNYRVHINLSAIADQKANIMISVNAILISVLISILSYRNLTETTPQIFVPTIIFLITGLTSLIFAILSARPKVTKLNDKKATPETIKKNLVFFGNFVNLELDQFEEGMQALYDDPKLLLDNMTRDIYFLGKVLDKKYRFLTISYNVFMVGFVATVILFIVAMFFG